MDCEEDNGHYKCKHRKKIMANYEIYGGRVVFTTKDHGAILMDDELWHPFRYFDNGDLDIGDDGFCKPSSAFKLAELTYT